MMYLPYVFSKIAEFHNFRIGGTWGWLARTVVVLAIFGTSMKCKINTIVSSEYALSCV